MHSAAAELNPMDAPPVSTVLERVGAELGNLADQVDTLQDTLGPLLLDAATHQPHAMIEIQALDAIAQTLSSLSTFVGGLARSGLHPQPIAVGELADRLTLSDLADRLRGYSPNADDDFEMF